METNRNDAFALAQHLVETILVRRTRIGYVPDVWTVTVDAKAGLADAA